MNMCQCGCGTIISEKNRFVHGHSLRLSENRFSWKGKTKETDERLVVTSNLRKAEARAGIGMFAKEAISKRASVRRESPEVTAKAVLTRKRNNSKWGLRQVRVCKICGKKFEIFASHSRPTTCSKECGYKLSSMTQSGKPKHTAESRRKTSSTITELWRGDMGKNIAKALHKYPNNFETSVQKTIDELGLSFVPNKATVINGHVPDHINNDGQKKAILDHGIRWHLLLPQETEPTLTKAEVERRDRIPYNELGFDVLFIWEDEMDDIEKVKRKIIDFDRKQTKEVFLR